MNRTRPLAAAACLALAATLTAAAPAGAATITMSGSTSVAPLATKLAKAFVKQPKYRGRVKFVILQGGSDIGITDVSRGRVTLGMSSRDPKPADPGGIVFNKIARDAVCVVTHRSNPIPTLSQGQIQDILLRTDPQLEPGARRLAPRPDRPGCPHRRLRYPGRLPEHLHGADAAGGGVGDDQSVERAAGADDQIGPERDRLRLLPLHQGPARRALPGRSLHAAQRQVGAVRGHP